MDLYINKIKITMASKIKSPDRLVNTCKMKRSLSLKKDIYINPIALINKDNVISINGILLDFFTAIGFPKIGASIIGK
jgi:hypothetical protein